MINLLFLAGDIAPDNGGLPIKCLPLTLSDRPQTGESVWLDETGDYHNVKSVKSYLPTGSSPHYVEIYLDVENSAIDNFVEADGWLMYDQFNPGKTQW